VTATRRHRSKTGFNVSLQATQKSARTEANASAVLATATGDTTDAFANVLYATRYKFINIDKMLTR